MLLAMNPMATACQSAAAGRGPPDSSRSRRRQRTMRMGKVSVATITARSSGAGCASRMWRATSPGCTPRSDHTSRAAATAIPTSVASSWRPREGRLSSAVAKREREEVEQFVEERADGGQLTALLQGGHQLAPHIGGTLQRGAPAIAEGLDAQGFLFPGGRVEERLE